MRIVAVAVLITLLGCMGTAPVLVQQYQYGDEKKSCMVLRSEIDGTESDIARLESKRGSKMAVNAALITVGTLVFWPAYFFADTKSDELAEIEALKKRQAALKIIAIEKSCEWVVGEKNTLTIGHSSD